jgi:hypothetical protein
MPVSAPADLAQSLHETNTRLGFLLDGLIARTAPADTAPRPATPQEMARLLSELMRAGQRLRSLPSEKDAELEQELSAYRKQVERLRVLLPSIQQTLLGERARLERERARVVSAAEWACRSRLTL